MRVMTKVLACLAILLGFLVILGWLFDVTALVQIHEDLVPMQMYTAINFVFMGTALLLLSFDKYKISSLFAFLVIVLSSISLCEYLFSQKFGLSDFLIQWVVDTRSDSYSRMAPNTSLCFLLLSVSSFCLSYRNVAIRLHWFIQFSVILIIGISLFAIIGYSTGYQVTYEWGRLTQMALHTSIGVLFLGAGYQNYLFTQAATVTSRRTIYRPIPISVAVLLLFLIIAFVVRKNHLSEVQNNVKSRNQVVQHVLLNNLKRQVKMLKRMQNRVANDDDFKVEEWKKDAVQYLEDTNSLHAIGLHTIKGQDDLYIASVSNLEDLDLTKLVSKHPTENSILAIVVGGVKYIVFILYSPEDVSKDVHIAALYNFADFVKQAVPYFLLDNYELDVDLQNNTLPIEKSQISSPFSHQLDFNVFNSKFILRIMGKPVSFLKDVNIMLVSIIVVGLLLSVMLSYLIIFANKAVKREQEALAANQAKNTFLSNISHELRNPLNTIIGASSLLQETGLDGRQLKYLNSIENSGVHLVSLIEDILDISKLESGQISFTYTEKSVKKLYDEIISQCSTKVEAKGLRLVSSIETSGVDVVITDHLRLKQVILNLIDNAIKFTDKGDIEFALQVKKGTSHGVELSVQIRDSGIGIPKEKLPFIFEKFYQVDLTTKKTIQGIGLGLAICQEIIMKLGGKINVRSEFGNGSTFSLAIPVETPKKKD